MQLPPNIIRTAKVEIPPPLIFVVYAALSFAVEYILPSEIVSGIWRYSLFGFFLILGGGLMFICIKGFKKNQIAIEPWKTTTKIMDDGPYKYSRNPIYLSFLLIALGLGFGFNNFWFFALLVPFVFALKNMVILREETYLEKKFGSQYTDYKSRVRRWF